MVRGQTLSDSLGKFISASLDARHTPSPKSSASHPPINRALLGEVTVVTAMATAAEE